MVLNGIDISSWQGNIDLARVPCDFVIIKATEGTSYVNPYCDSSYQLAKKVGKLLGIYHYAKNGDPIKEADFFFYNTKEYVGEAIFFLDYEESVSINSPVWCRKFLDRLKELTGGHKGMLYTYKAMLNSQNWQEVKDGDYGLWYASYGVNAVTPGFKQPPTPQVKYWRVPAIFQYNSQTRLEGYYDDLDANVFYGDKKAWLAYTANKTTSAKPPNTISFYSTKGKSLEEMAQDIQQGKAGNGDNRENNLGSYYNAAQAIVNHRLNILSTQQVINILVDNTTGGLLDNGEKRKQLLGNYYEPVQKAINTR